MLPALERRTFAGPPAGVREPAKVRAAAALLGLLWGGVTALAGLNALYLCAGMIGCAFIALDFRIGVVLLIVLMPLSGSYLFPHEMFGIKGLNPVNLVLAATLASYCLAELADGGLRRLLPPALLGLYVAPIVIAGLRGVRHFGEIAPVFFMSVDGLDFQDPAGYLVDVVAKPLLLVVFSLLVGAAAAKSDKPEKFLLPVWIAIWVMGLMVVGYVLHSGIGLQQLASGGERAFLGALGMHANEFGRLYLVAYALLLFTWAETKEPAARLGLAASIGLAAVALMLTFSRGSFAGFALVNVLFLLWRRNAGALVFFGLLAAVALFALPAAVYDRVQHGFGHGLNSISADRIDGLWLPLLPQVLRHPLFGSGLESILWSAPMRTGAGVSVLATTHPHNAYLEALLDMGIVGLALACAYFALVWKGLRALAADTSVAPRLRGFFLGAAAALFALLASYFTDSSLRPKPEQVFLWLAIGMMYGLRRPRRPRA